MKVAIIHEMCVKIGGAEKVVQSFLKLYPDADLYSLILDEDKMEDFFGSRKIITPNISQRIYKLFKNQRFCLPFMSRAIESLDFSSYDLVIASSSGFAHGAITKPETKFIVYSHAPARYLWDYSNEYKKQIGFNEGIKSYFLNKLFLRLRIWDYMSSQRADKILANSENTKNRIKKYHRRNSQVLYPPIEVKRFQKTSLSLSLQGEKNKKNENYYIIISALTAFKRLDIAISGFNKLPNQNLVIIGKWEQSEELLWLVRGKNISFVWAQYWDDLVSFVQNSQGLIFPGEEDFGIVPVEVLAAGKPVFAFAKWGLLETVSAGITGEFFHDSEGSDFSSQFQEFNKNNLDGKYKSWACRNSAEKFSEANFLKKLTEIVWS